MNPMIARTVALDDDPQDVQVIVPVGVWTFDPDATHPYLIVTDQEARRGPQRFLAASDKAPESYPGGDVWTFFLIHWITQGRFAPMNEAPDFPPQPGSLVEWIDEDAYEAMLARSQPDFFAALDRAFDEMEKGL